jgi:hypothetical protein
MCLSSCLNGTSRPCRYATASVACDRHRCSEFGVLIFLVVAFRVATPASGSNRVMLPFHGSSTVCGQVKRLKMEFIFGEGFRRVSVLGYVNLSLSSCVVTSVYSTTGRTAQCKVSIRYNPWPCCCIRAVLRPRLSLQSRKQQSIASLGQMLER